MLMDVNDRCKVAQMTLGWVESYEIAFIFTKIK